MSTNLSANKVVENLSNLVIDIPENSIVSHSVYSDKSLKVILFGFAPGESLSEHTSAFPAILHFLDGEADVTLGDEQMSASPGAWMHMPAHLPHSITAKETAVKMLLLMLKG